MDTDSKQIAEMVRSGEYFEQSRQWYRTIYIGPLSERTFFLLISLMAGLVAFFAFVAILAFLPVTDRPPLLVATDRIDETVPHLQELQPKGMPINTALMRFFAKTYVERREGYSADSYARDYYFIKAQSDPIAFKDYLASYGSTNPQSPAAILGRQGKRRVTIESIDIRSGSDPKTATVQFSTDVEGTSNPTHAEWTAVLQFYYTDLVVTPVRDLQTNQEIFKTQDPQFQVVNYVLTQNH
jgi:type IV secretory pathway component VirB8